MHHWAITVRAPLTRLDVDDTVARFARSLFDLPPHRAGNVTAFELFAADLDSSSDLPNVSLLLLTVDSQADSVLAGIVTSLKDTLPETFVVTGLALTNADKSSHVSAAG